MPANGTLTQTASTAPKKKYASTTTVYHPEEAFPATRFVSWEDWETAPPTSLPKQTHNNTTILYHPEEAFPATLFVDWTDWGDGTKDL